MEDTGISDAVSEQVEACDVCIVGAGLAGMNALFVASRYLTPSQRVILVDSRSRVGGMWVDTYPYVRLHQPHGMFTAGNIEWTLGREPGYLATRGEVLDHFDHCLDVIRQRVRVDEYYGWTLESDDDAGGFQRITCRSADGRLLTINAKRLIKAYGLRITPNDPLPVSSTRVRSVSPDSCDLWRGEMRSSRTPVWVIGSGKTAMDTVHTLVSEDPGREVNLVAGSGTFFANRDRCFPTGRRRWTNAAPLSGIAYHTARRYDGTNEAEVGEWYRGKYGTWLTPATGNYLLGVLSEAENKTIAAGLNEIVMDHLDDVVDDDGGTHLVLRSGARRAIAPDSWIVNCTGYLLRDGHPYEPYVSRGGSVVSIQMRSAPLHLSSYIAYFLTHLMFLGKITDVPLYALDDEELRRKSTAALPYAMLALVQHNLSLIADNVPNTEFTECGLDFDRWYPLPHRMLGTARFMLTHRRDREHHRRTLDTVRERFDVRCGPLVADNATIR